MLRRGATGGAGDARVAALVAALLSAGLATSRRHDNARLPLTAGLPRAAARSR
jgi:hypothetical protein